MQDQEIVTSPEVLVTCANDDEQQQQQLGNGECCDKTPTTTSCCRAAAEDSPTSTGTKTKRKARSTRRKLNAMINNTSLHFSDTDSEGELTAARVSTPNHTPTALPKSESDSNFLQPVISVTLDGSDDSSYGGERRNSYLENVTDVDEIYTSEPEIDGLCSRRKSRACASPRGSLTVAENPQQGETDLEDVSNDEEESVQPPIVVQPRSDILCDFNGETITTKEGDGPFSIEIRNQMSIDEAKPAADAPDVLVMPTTDSEDMEASDEDEELEGACGQRESLEDYDVMAASQIVMKNVNKMEQLLAVSRDVDEASVSDSHTDVEDIE